MHRPTFLIGEPEPGQALSARKLVLETAKYNVLTAHSGSELLQQARRFPKVDAIILVEGLRHPDCNRVIPALRENKDCPPIILLSPNHTLTCSGAEFYLSSHEPEELVVLLRTKFGDPRHIPSQPGLPEVSNELR